MVRAVLEPLALFLSPFAVYAIYLALRARYPLEVEHWTRGRVSVMTLVGLAAAAWGAFVFVFACPSDDPLYIAVWYSVGCGIVVLSSRLILPRLARW